MESRENHFSADTIAFFMSMPIFDRINAEEIKVIARHMNKVALNKGDILFRESGKGSYVCFVRETSPPAYRV